MAQKRMLSRRITESDKISALQGNDRARFIYTALLPHTDKAGRVNANPLGLKGTIFEAFEYSVDDIQQALEDLAAVGLVTLYSSGRHKLLAEYTKFAEFNTPHPKEAESDLPGPEDAGTTAFEPSGNLPGKDPTRIVEGSTPTPTLTPTKPPTKTRPHALAIEDSAEARFDRLARTGHSEHAEASRVRATVRRLAGDEFAHRNEGSTSSWSRHTTQQIEAFWIQSDPANWKGEESKQRPWIFSDLLNEKRHLPGKDKPREPERDYSQPITGADLLDDNGSLEGNWKN